jgi:hypothetical protein
MENKFWSEMRQRLRGYSDWGTFKNWDLVRSLPLYSSNEYFADYRDGVLELFSTLSLEQQRVWKGALKEPFLGHTELSYLEAQRFVDFGGDKVETSAFVLRFAYIVLMFQQMSGRNILDYEQIVEFGGGVGELARFVRDIGFVGDYYIYDLPEMGVISQFYNMLLRKDIKHVTHYSVIPNNKRTLFVGAWSFSEIPFDYRKEIANHFNGKDFLIVFQSSIWEYDNTHYFTLRFWEDSDTFVRLKQIPFHGSGSSFFAVSQKG